MMHFVEDDRRSTQHQVEGKKKQRIVILLMVTPWWVLVCRYFIFDVSTEGAHGLESSLILHSEPMNRILPSEEPRVVGIGGTVKETHPILNMPSSHMLHLEGANMMGSVLTNLRFVYPEGENRRRKIVIEERKEFF